MYSNVLALSDPGFTMHRGIFIIECMATTKATVKAYVLPFVIGF